MRKAAVLYFIITVVLSVSSGVTGNTSRPEHLKDTQVLILVGPQYGLPMVDQLLPALMHDLKEGGISLNNIFVEFLDLHRNTDPQYRADVLALLKHKLKEREPELIIAINQGAVDFIASDGKNLCPGVPLMIPILEKHPEWEGEPRKLIKLTTQQDAAGTLSYALRLFPETNRAVIIMGKDDHEAPFVEPISEALDAVRNGLEIETTEDLTIEEMLAMISNLPANTIAFYGSYFHDITGRSFAPAEVARRVGKTANVPVFAFRDMHIASGLAGGSVAITADMGRLAAQISLEYFDGKLVLEEPVTNFEVPNFPLFNWMQLKQMGGNISTLPENTVFLNRPLTIWEEHRETVITAAISFVLLVLLLIALAFRNRQQKKLIVKLNEAGITLRESEALLARSQEIAHVGSWKLDLSTNKLTWSDETYRIFGCQPQELTATYEAFLGFIHPDDRAAVEEAYSGSLREGTDSYEIEHRIVRKETGEIRHVYERCVHVRDDEGAIVQSIGMVQDITEDKHAEELIRESAERAKMQSNLIAQLTFADSVVSSNVDDALKILTTKLAANMQVERVSVWLISEDEKKLQRLALYDADSGFDSQIDILNTADIPSYFEALRNDSQVDADDAQNDPRTEELTDNYFIRLHISSLLDSAIQQDGRLIGILSAEHRGPIRQWHADEKSFLSAIANLVAQLFANTERRQAEEKLSTSEKRYRSVSAVSNTGAWEFHRKENFLWCSPEYFEMLGRNPEDYPMNGLSNLEESWINLIHPDDRQSAADHFANYLEAGSVGMYENNFRMSHANGNWLWIWSRGQTLCNPDGSVSDYTVGTHINITERILLQQELEIMNAELEKKVEQRTALLEASNKELEAFSYSVSHDLRAPLRHINGFVDMLSSRFKEELPEKAHHYLDTISGASRQMGTLIDELLQYSRTGRQEVRKTELDMNLLVKEVIDQLKTGLEERKIKWNIQVLPKAFGDYKLLKLVWTNLLDNAVKYTRNKKTAEISVSCREEAKSFVFCISDNGVGFDMKYAHKLFGVFQRLHSQSEFEGTGIGLANIQRIVHKHLGRVWAEAESGKGAKFYFSLPK